MGFIEYESTNSSSSRRGRDHNPGGLWLRKYSLQCPSRGHGVWVPVRRDDDDDGPRYESHRISARKFSRRACEHVHVGRRSALPFRASSPTAKPAMPMQLSGGRRQRLPVGRCAVSRYRWRSACASGRQQLRIGRCRTIPSWRRRGCPSESARVAGIDTAPPRK